MLNPDLIIYDWVISIRIDMLNQFFILITNLASIWFVIPILICSVLFLFKHKKYLFFLFSNVLIGTTLDFIIKIVISRERPPISNSLVVENSYSFPSGHTITTVVLYFSIFIIFNTLYSNVSKQLKYIINTILIFLIVCIPFSRMYLGVHWFSDVFFGYIIGFIIVFVTKKLYKIKKHIF